MADRVLVQRRLGERIAQARAEAGLTQTSLAERARMERTQLVRVEAGDRKVTVAELSAIADELGLSLDWFVTDSPEPVLSRRRDDAPMHETSRSLDLAVDRAGRDVRFLLELGTLSGVAEEIANVPATYDDAELLAAATRRRIGIDAGSIDDLGLVVEQLGLVWYSEDLGMLAGDGACIELSASDGTRLGVAVVNGSREPGRRRWTLAHELGHFLMGDAYAAEHPAGEIERFINVFVAYFLMPRNSVEQLWRVLGDEGARRVALAVAARHRVSWSAACNQLRNLQRITEEERLVIMDAVPRRGEFLAVGEAWTEDLQPPAVPPAYATLVLRDFVQGKIAADRTVELLRGTVTLEDLPERTQELRYELLSEQ